jgi:hypothetical protein
MDLGGFFIVRFHCSSQTSGVETKGKNQQVKPEHMSDALMYNGHKGRFERTLAPYLSYITL